ncbi:MAG: hypothetical protein ABEH83_12750 [Halobacterium sp.]
MADSTGTLDDRSVSRYDVILAGVPLTFLAAFLVGAYLFDSTVASLSLASVASTATVADGLFVHGPDGDVSD